MIGQRKKAPGLGYMTFDSCDETHWERTNKNIDITMQKKLVEDLNVKEGDAVFFICDKKNEATSFVVKLEQN